MLIVDPKVLIIQMLRNKPKISSNLQHSQVAINNKQERLAGLKKQQQIYTSSMKSNDTNVNHASPSGIPQNTTDAHLFFKYESSTIKIDILADNWCEL